MESPQKNGSGVWSRREFTVKDDDKYEVRVKLWGPQTELIDTTFVDKKTEIKNVRLDRWGGVNCLGSTDETMIRVRTATFRMIMGVHGGKPYSLLNLFLNEPCPVLDHSNRIFEKELP